MGKHNKEPIPDYKNKDHRVRRADAISNLALRDLSTEGVWRKRRKSDPRTKGKGNKAQYRAEYLGETLTPDEFRLKYCPEWKLNHLLYYRRYVPAEIIVRYNGVHTPIFMPDVPYQYRDLKRATVHYPTKATRKAKAKVDKEIHGDIIEKVLIL